MDKAKLTALILMLYAQEIEIRAGMVKDAAKENGIKEGELYKLLKQEGFEPKAPKGTVPGPANETPPSGENNSGANIQQQSNNNPPPPAPPNNGQNNNNQPDNDQDTGQIPILVSHKTEYEKYRCAGLVLTRKPENYLVTKAQFEKLNSDPWVAVAK